MAKQPMGDVVVLLPGILGSVLQRDGKDVWAMSAGAAFRALFSFGGSIKKLELDGDDPDVDDLGDGVTAPRILPDLHIVPGLWKIDGYGDNLVTALNGVSAELTTAELSEMNRLIGIDGDDPEQVAADWISDNL